MTHNKKTMIEYYFYVLDMRYVAINIIIIKNKIIIINSTRNGQYAQYCDQITVYFMWIRNMENKQKLQTDIFQFNGL